MKSADVKIGETYTAKVSGKVVPVKIVSEGRSASGQTFWMARNLDTGREVRIYSPQRLRGKANAEPPGVRNGVIVDAAYWHWIDSQRAASLIR